MFNKLKFSGIILISLISFGSTNASTIKSDWKDVPASTATKMKSSDKVFPDKFRSLELNYNVFSQEMLKAKVNQSNSAQRVAPVTIELPLPYGDFESFIIEETPMMEEGLALKFPSIKTYTARSTKNPGTIAKMDIGPFGFHAMVLSPEGRYFIDPVNNQTTSNYISYYRKDIPTWANTFSCHTVADEQFELDTKNRLEEYYSRSSQAPVQLRTYRLALACTGEYSKASTGLANPTKEQVLAKMVVSMNRVNGVYETEVAVHMDLIANNDLLIFLDANTDPYNNNDGGAMLSQNHNRINTTIGTANYDIGHVFSTGGGGIAALGSVCVPSTKGMGVTGSPSPVGDPFDIDYVAHEMGHQFAGNHTFNSVTSSCGGGNRSSSTAFEPGSGTTIMAYAGICGADDIKSNSDPYFHAGSIDEIMAFITNGQGNNCAVKTSTGNNPPVVDAGDNYTIPLGTPFILTGSATDPDGDNLTYSWEQMDLGPAGAHSNPTGNAPLFRFYPPVSAPVRMFPKLNDILNNVTVKGERLPSYGRTMVFRLTARDNKPMAGTTGKDQMTITVAASAGPFSISNLNSMDTLSVGTLETINWNVNNTNNAPVNCTDVRILLSIDGGQTFPHVLAESTPNDGSQAVLIPNAISNNARVKVEAIGNIFFDINNAALRVVAPQGAGFNLSTWSDISPNVVCAPDSAVFNITTAEYLGFNSAITLSTTGLPSGATATFSENPVMPGDTVTLKVSLTGVAAGAKNFNIRATSGSMVKSELASFTVASAITAKATVTYPVMAQSNINPNNFSPTWNTVPSAIGYSIQIATDTTFNNIISDTVILGNSSVTYLAPKIAQGQKFFIRAAARSACGNAPYSDIISFITASVPEAPSNLIQLSSTATSATLRWMDNSINDSGFRIERSDNTNDNYENVGQTNANVGTGNRSFTAHNLVNGTTYYFRVYAVNYVGNSDYTNELMINFTTGINSAADVKMISIYPNPSKDVFYLELEDAFRGETSITIVDELGRSVWSEVINKNDDLMKAQIDLSSQSNGVYFIKIDSKDKHLTRRLIKLN